MGASRLASCLTLLALGLGASAHAQEPPSEERLMEQIERARRAFQTDVEGAPGRSQASEQELIERVRRVRERLRGGVESEPAPALDEAAVAELKERFAEELGLEVLGVEAIERDGSSAYAVKVMNPAGNSNAAFQVSTLIVDRDSGEVLGQRRDSIGTAAGFPEPGVRFQPDIDSSGLTIRRRTYR